MAPSRRQPNIASARGASVEQEEEAETVEQRHARTRAAVLERRQLQEIADIERELVDGSPASDSVLGLSSNASKRPASQDLSMRHRRAFPPPPYKGASLKELRDFLLSCEVFFGAVEEHDESRRIAVAASYLREDALRAWSRLGTEQPSTWSAFERVLRDIV